MTIDFQERHPTDATVYIRDSALLEGRLAHLSQSSIDNAKQKLHSIIHKYHIYDPDEEGLEKLLQALRQNGSPTSSLANYYNVYRHWAAARGMPEIKNREFKIDNNKLPPYTKEEVQTILRTIETTTGNARDRAIVATFAHTGLRRKEIQFLQMKDLLNEDLQPAKNLDEVVLIQVADNGRGIKSHQRRVVPVTKELRVYLKEYVAMRNRGLAQMMIDSPWLFVTRKGGQMSEDTIYGTISKYVKRLGIKKRGRCHSMRRYFITTMGKSDVNMEKIRKIAGHSSCDQTAAYMDYGTKDLIETMKGIKF